MKNRITELFAAKKKDILAVYYTAGFPGIDDTVPIALALERGGADLIEIGIPFSDPVADGPTIQQSNKIALDNGMNVRQLLGQVEQIRTQCRLPVVLMGYLNPIMQYGMESFVRDATAAGVDGVIIPDLPIPEFETIYRKMFAGANLKNMFLVAPTTSEERIRRIDSITDGFIYAVSASSTTGGRGNFTSDQTAYFRRLEGMGLSNPFLIGFGIGDRETFRAACAAGAGAIVGSAFIRHLQREGPDAPGIERFVKILKGNDDDHTT